MTLPERAVRHLSRYAHHSETGVRIARAAVVALALLVPLACAHGTSDATVVAVSVAGPSTTSSSTSSPPTTSPPTTSPPTTIDVTHVPIPRAAAALPARACYDLGGDNIAVVVDCAQLHDGQSVRADVVLAAVTPAEADAAQWINAARTACADDFTQFVGYRWDTANASFTLEAVFLAAGPPVHVACVAVRPRHEKWANTAEQAMGSYDGIRVGDCFNFPSQHGKAMKTSCDSPHQAEMFVRDAPVNADRPDAPYPTRQEWQRIAQPVCEGAFQAFTGGGVDGAPDLGYSIIFPPEAAWHDPTQRRLSCAVTRRDGALLTASVHH
jgi:hypothetical protein